MTYVLNMWNTYVLTICFFCTFVISILSLSCQSTISLLFIIYLEFWDWLSTINISKELKGRLGPFSHFQPLSQKHSQHFGNSAGESSSWNKRNYVSEDAKSTKDDAINTNLSFEKTLYDALLSRMEHRDVE